MDIELARTFIEIVSTGSFIKAADRLHVAQTTVSARVRLLEQQLGRPLFVRNKAGASLTPAGEQFLRFAPTFVQLWQRAKQQVAVPEGHSAVLTIGSEVSLWRPLLIEWVRTMRRSRPDIALRVHVDVPQDLITHVAAGLVDIAIMYAPHAVPNARRSCSHPSVARGCLESRASQEPTTLPTPSPARNTPRMIENAYVVAPNIKDSRRVHTTSEPRAVRPESAMEKYTPRGIHPEDAERLSVEWRASETFSRYGARFDKANPRAATTKLIATATSDAVLRSNRGSR